MPAGFAVMGGPPSRGPARVLDRFLLWRGAMTTHPRMMAGPGTSPARGFRWLAVAVVALAATLLSARPTWAQG